jgi:hypothetical protein
LEFHNALGILFNNLLTMCVCFCYGLHVVHAIVCCKQIEHLMWLFVAIRTSLDCATICQ